MKRCAGSQAMRQIQWDTSLYSFILGIIKACDDFLNGPRYGEIRTLPHCQLRYKLGGQSDCSKKVENEHKYNPVILFLCTKLFSKVLFELTNIWK